MCAGPLPWDLLSESSEEGLTPRERQSLVAEEEEPKPVQQTTANGSAILKAPAPDAKGILTAKTMSIADQLATGLLTAGEHLQAGFLPFCAFRCSAPCAHQDPPFSAFWCRKTHQAPCRLGLSDVMLAILTTNGRTTYRFGRGCKTMSSASSCRPRGHTLHVVLQPHPT